jgi:hypothetical protein
MAVFHPLVDFLGWQLAVHCPACKVMRCHQVDALAARVGCHTLVAEVVNRLRCSTCGGAAGWTKLSGPAGASGLSRVEIVVRAPRPR